MLARHDDFALEIDHAAGLLMDATCSLRAAGLRSLPHPHRHLLIQAIRSLERAQDTIFLLRNEDAWAHQPPKSRELTMV